MKFAYLKLLDELNKKEPNFKLVEKVIKQDVSMSYSLLSIINSAAYGYDVKSIRQAIVLLGIDRLRKWCTLYFLKGLSQDKPDILFKTTLIRGYFAEFLAENFIDEDKELFMLGAFSLIDVYLDRKIEDILNEVSIPSDFRSALIDREGKLGDLLTLIETFNRFDSDKLDYYLNKYSLDLNQVSEKYLESLQIADKILSDFE
jgi:EAL and modified HD-GYP domain-containing signal transduction protein